MIGEQYWATGLILRPSLQRVNQSDRVRWSVRVEFYDDGWAQDGSTEGVLHSRYPEDDLAQAIDTLRQDAAKLGIRFERVGLLPFLSIEGDGKSQDWPSPPGWRALLREQAARIGFDTYELAEAAAETPMEV